MHAWFVYWFPAGDSGVGVCLSVCLFMLLVWLGVWLLPVWLDGFLAACFLFVSSDIVVSCFAFMICH